MTTQNKKKERDYAQLTGFRRSVPIILFALAVFIGLCFITKDTGTLGRAISSVLLGLFSIGGYFIPAFLAVHAVFYPSDFKKKRTLTRVIFTLITVTTIAALAHTVEFYGEALSFSASKFYTQGKAAEGGGFIGGTISFVLTKLFGKVGLIIIAVLVFALYITYFFAGGKTVLSRLLLKILNAISNFFTSLSEKKKEKKKKKDKRESLRERRRIASIAEKQELLTDDEFFEADNGMSELTISELGISEIRNGAELERNPHLQSKVFHKSETSGGNVQKERPTYESPSYSEPVTRRAVNLDYSTTDSYHDLASSASDAFYDPKTNDIIYEEKPIITDSHTDKDASADDIFGDRFEPFDLKINEELSNKKSSRSKEPIEPIGINEFTESINNVTPEDVERARRRADFEMKKKAALEAQKRYAEEQAEIVRTRNAAAADRSSTTGGYGYREAPEPAQSEPYIPDYMQRQEEPVNIPEPQKAEPYDTEKYKREESFRSAMSDYEREHSHTEPEPAAEEAEDTVVQSQFRPYTPPSVSDIPEPIPEPVPEEITITRTMLDPTPTITEYSEEPEAKEAETAEPAYSEYEDEEDEAEDTALDFSDEDGEDVIEEIPPHLQNPDVIAQRGLFPFLDADNVKEPEDAPTAYDSYTEEPESEDEDEPPFEVAEPTPSAFTFKEPLFSAPKEKAPEPKPEPVPEEKPDYSDYQYPSVELLAKGKPEEDFNQEEEKNQNAEKLVDALLQFNVRISIKGIDRGPRITRYEIVPARGVKVNSVTNLFNDIALNLGVEGMRMEAPIPGKSAIGVEIPNKKPSTVLLRDLVESDEFICASSKTMSCLGKDVTGNPVFADIAKMPHILIAGATGMGKSVCINSILISILYKARPDEVKFIMIDPKKVEFNGYNGIPHLLVPVVTDVKQAAGALMWAVEQMEKRYELMEALEVRKLDSYNEKVRENPELGEPLPKIIIVIDELNDIMLQVRKPAEDLIMSIAQKARAAGIHLIIGTQRPSVDVITGVIKANIPSRISCKVASYNDSKTILEQAGAEKLLNNGDMLYIPAGAPKALRVQGAFVSDNEVSAVMKFLKSQSKGAVYDAQALEEINRAAQKCSKGKGGDDLDDGDDDGDSVGVLNDRQFLDAVELAVKSGKISTSLIQRKISIGYGKAAKFIDIMEDMGIVSEPNGQKPRDVLINRDEWHEMLSRRELD